MMMKQQFALCAGAAVAFAVSGASANAGLYLWGGSGPNVIFEVDTTIPDGVNPLVTDRTNAVAGFEYGLGAFYAASTNNNSDLFVINPGTGLTTSTITMTFPGGGDVITSMDFVGNTLYGGFTTEGGGGASSLVTIDTTTGLVSMVGAMGINNPTGGLTFGNGNLYTVNAGGSGAAILYTVSLITGLATPVGPVTDATGAPVTLTGLEFGTDGILYGLGRRPNDDMLFSIDPATGAAVNLGLMASVSSTTSLTAIPAPASGLLLALGGLCAARRRR